MNKDKVKKFGKSFAIFSGGAIAGAGAATVIIVLALKSLFSPYI